jgi:hypothetical protein
MLKEKFPLIIVCDQITLFYLFSILFSCIQIFLIERVDYIPLIVALLVSLITNIILNYNRKCNIDKNFKLFMALTFYYIIALGVNLYAYPYFPLLFSQDFIVHVSNAFNLIKGASIQSIFSSNPSFPLLLASWLTISSDNPLLSTRIFLSIVLLSSLPFVYFIGDYIKENGGFIASLVYICINPFIYFTMLTCGLYANALGLVLSLSTISWFIVTVVEENKKRLLFLPFCGFILFLTHSTNVLIFLTLFFATLYMKFFENYRVSIKPVIFLFSGILITLLLVPTLISRLPSTLSSPFGLIEMSSNELIVYILREIPLLKFIYLSSSENIFVLILFLVSIVLPFVYLLKRRLGFGIIPYAWLLLIVITSLFSTNIWRFALIAFIPLSLLSPLIYGKIVSPFIVKIAGFMPSEKFRKALKYMILILLFLMLYLYSLNDIFTPIYASSWSRSQQNRFYECLIWFKDNSEYNASVVSIGGGSWIHFLPLISNRTILEILPGERPEVAYEILKGYSNGYVVVWNRLHPYNGSFYYVDLYKNSSLFREVWANEEVTVFKPIK